MKYYAIYDLTAKKNNPGNGFANTKKAVCFSTFSKLMDFLEARKDWDYSSKRITRKEAMSMLESFYGEKGKKGLDLDHWYEQGQDFKMVCLWTSVLY